MHKFKSGDLMQFQTGFLQPRTASGVYTVVRVLPASPDGHLQLCVDPYRRFGIPAGADEARAAEAFAT